MGAEMAGISSEVEAILRRRAKADGVSVETYIEHHVREDGEWGELAKTPISTSETDFAELRSEVREGLEQAQRGECCSAEEVFAELRAKHGISS
jgi:hypothetical protein